MKLPPYDFARQKWDDYAMPHVVHGDFIYFSTGMLIYTRTNPNPGDRHMYRDFNVEICMTTDGDCPALYDDAGTLIPKAWLTQGGGQHLMIDHDHGVAVGLQGCSRYVYNTYLLGGTNGAMSRARSHQSWADKQAPEYLSGRFSTYWSGPSRLPVGAPIKISPPLTITKEQRSGLVSLKDQIGTWLALHGVNIHDVWGTIKIAGQEVKSHPAQLPVTTFLDKRITELTPEMRVSFYRRGYSAVREKFDVTYLYTKPLTDRNT